MPAPHVGVMVPDPDTITTPPPPPTDCARIPIALAPMVRIRELFVTVTAPPLPDDPDAAPITKVLLLMTAEESLLTIPK